MDSIKSEDKLPSPNSSQDSSKVKENTGRCKKRKRVSSDSSSDNELILPDNALITERNVHECAVKNNLDDISVRKILKKVVTNDHVLALVKLQEEEEDSGSGNEDENVVPKLTRAKVKELKKVSPRSAWNLEKLELTPINHIPVKTRPEVKALIAQDLPEDEDDEEYEPTNDDVPSEDEHVESCSDAESQPRAAASPAPAAACDGPFKVPQDISSVRRKLDVEEATIALRTRSKLSLSSTSIEHIESTFVPPDDLPMEVDDDVWSEFLNECLNPASTSKNEDDDEADPEYNVAADPDANDEDDLTTAIKISKRELNDLVTELFSVIPEGTQEALAEDLANSVLTDNSQNEISQWHGKQEPASDETNTIKMSERLTFEKRNTFNRTSTGKNGIEEQSKGFVQPIKVENFDVIDERNSPPALQICIDEQDIENVPGQDPPLLLRSRMEPVMETVTINIENNVTITPEQVLILQQQLRQHIQLSASNFLQLYVHPVHWSKGPVYKEYLTTLSKIGESNPKSIVNVCNLKPAMELVNTWEATMSVDNEENREMIEFISKEIEKSKQRFVHNRLYIGDFPERMKSTIASSPVFLYPHLLPAAPYREQPLRRYSYLMSEDELIVLGLDQFWKYMEANPSIFKRRSSHPRHRASLRSALALVVKHMLPWMTIKSLAAHVAAMRHADQENPIKKYFNENVINPVEHRILQFNPNITLYEQPEHEMPRLWVRYLGKTSKRFRGYIRRRQVITGFTPVGVPIQSVTPEATVKKPLPTDFTKKINCVRTALKSTTDQQMNVVQTGPQVMTATNLFTLVQTSTGSVLVPLEIVTNTVNSTQTVPTPAVVSTIDDHCSCCVLLRKICKKKQSLITDYFGNGSVNKQCYCKNVTQPKISNKLKLLISNFKNRSGLLYDNVDKMLNGEGFDDKYSFEDYAAATSYQLKIVTYVSASKRLHVKRRLINLFSSFNIDKDDPVKLANDLHKVYDTELYELYMDFLAFLTPEQADRVQQFKDYFVRDCVKELFMKIDEQVKDKEKRNNILSLIKSMFGDNMSSACEMCTYLLRTMSDYEALAEFTFKLFPHRHHNRARAPTLVVANGKVLTNNEMNNETVNKTQTIEDNSNYEADQSDNEEESGEEDVQMPETAETNEISSDTDTDDNKSDVMDYNIEEKELTVVLEEDVKKEPSEWKRDEDRLILEVLQQKLTPEDRKHASILKMLADSDCYNVISESLTHKSIDEVKERVSYLLSMLIANDSSES